jgi:hypothetical protein
LGGSLFILRGEKMGTVYSTVKNANGSISYVKNSTGQVVKTTAPTVNTAPKASTPVVSAPVSSTPKVSNPAPAPVSTAPKTTGNYTVIKDANGNISYYDNNKGAVHLHQRLRLIKTEARVFLQINLKHGKLKMYLQVIKQSIMCTDKTTPRTISIRQ